jgi:hypothetical protein
VTGPIGHLAHRNGIVVPQRRVRVAAIVSTRVHVDDRGVEAGDAMKQPVADVLGDPMALAHRHILIDGDRE